MIIVVEGCDKTGKTSLCAELSRCTGVPVKKFGPPSDRVLGEYFEAVDSGHDFVADRFHLGELVYAPIYRGYVPDPALVERLEDRLVARGALLVLMEDDVPAVVGRFRALREDFAREGDVVSILCNFAAAYERSRLAKVRLRWSADAEEQQRVVERVLELAGQP